MLCRMLRRSEGKTKYTKVKMRTRRYSDAGETHLETSCRQRVDNQRSEEKGTKTGTEQLNTEQLPEGQFRRKKDRRERG